MSTRKHLVSVFLGLAALTTTSVGLAADKELPAVIRSLERQGLSGVQEFPAGAGLRGFAAVAGQQPVAIYVTPDGNAIVGSRLGPDGQSLDEQHLKELVAKPMAAAIWAKLASSSWVQDGKADAPRIIYTFGDPNCPYCHRFWEAARPWVNAGKVQLRHVIVGIIREDSRAKAAAILGASDKTAAFLENENHFSQGGIAAAANVPANIAGMLDDNEELMAQLGFRGTPGIVFRDKDGLIQQLDGMPLPAVLLKLFGPR